MFALTVATTCLGCGARVFVALCEAESVTLELATVTTYVPDGTASVTLRRSYQTHTCKTRLPEPASDGTFPEDCIK